MGIVHYANYLVWMEIGRTEFCRSIGLRYREMESSDRILLTMAEANCRYHSPARYDDEVVVRTWIGQAHPRMVTFAYEIVRADDGRKLASGSSKHVSCGPDLKPVKLPRKYWPDFSIGAVG